MKFLRICLTIMFVAMLFGCADMDTPTAKQVIENPIGLHAAKIGMTKAQVASIYGDPDMKRIVNSKDWTSEREEWFYKARMSGMPVGADYLSEDMYLYFDGDNLTNISREPIVTGTPQSEKTQSAQEASKQKNAAPESIK